MAMKVLRVQVASIELKSNGDPPSDPDAEKKAGIKTGPKNNSIVAKLTYPRSGAPLVTSKIDVDLESGKKKEFDLEDFWDSGLFKEELDGETILSIEIIDRDEISKGQRFAAKLFGAIFGGALKIITGGISDKIVGSVVALPVDAIKGSYNITGKETIDVIGRAEVKLKEGEIPEQLPLTLTAVKTIKKEFFTFKKPGSTKVVRAKKVLLKKGDDNGTIELRMKLVEV